MSSILTDTKKVLSIADEYEAFDLDIMLHINSVFATLNELGLGPEEGFMIGDKNAEWSDFIDDDIGLTSVKTYVCLRVRLLFDPPQTSYLIAALERQIDELTWRLSTKREATGWIDPDPPVLTDNIYDGGEP